MREHGAVTSSAGEGRVFAAQRADHAAAAARVLAEGAPHAGKIHEIAGEGSFTLAEYAAEIAKQSGKPVGYNPVARRPKGDPCLVAARGLGRHAGRFRFRGSHGERLNNGHALSQLIGCATAPLSASVALKGLTAAA